MNKTYYIKRAADYLEHHGIKGQKWGVRNGPPYPLDGNDHSLGERSAGSMVIPAAYVATIAVIAVAARLGAKEADKRQTKEYNEEYYQKRKIKSLDDIPKIDPSSMSMDDHMKAINPEYPDYGSTMNCMFCTTAMAMRMKGYDVTAEKSPHGWSSNNLESTWKDYKMEEPKCRSNAELEKYLANQGNGAYGNLMVFWNGGGGHSMFYHVDNGQVKIYDTQANKTREVRDFNGVVATKYTQVIRLDDKEPTEMALGAVKKSEGKA